MNAASDPRPRQSGRIQGRVLLALALILLGCMALRVRLADLPLDRDEGEYAYAGQLLLDGVPPYSGIYNMKMPGIYAVYAITLGLFGETPAAVRGGLVVVNSLSIILVFLLTRRHFDTGVALLASAIFAWMSLGRFVHGMVANAEHFVVLFALAGLVLLGAAARSRAKLVAAALCLGTGFVVKQHGALFVVFAVIALTLAVRKDPAKSKRGAAADVALFVLGAVLPAALTAALLAASGVFGSFWFWTVTYAGEYATARSPVEGLGVLGTRLRWMAAADLPIWILAAAGLVGVLTSRVQRTSQGLLLGFLLASAAAVSVGFYFRAHYFLYLLPPLAVLAALGIRWLVGHWPRWRTAGMTALVLVAILYGSWREREYLFRLDPDEVSRLVYQTNPFPEARVIGETIRERSEVDDRVFVFGSEPEILFYAQRRSATGYVYTYPLMEPQPFARQMQQQMISEVEASRPEFLVVVNEPMSWLRREDSADDVFRWIGPWAGGAFEAVAVADVQYPQPTVYRFGPEARTYRPSGASSLILYRRK